MRRDTWREVARQVQKDTDVQLVSSVSLYMSAHPTLADIVARRQVCATPAVQGRQWQGRQTASGRTRPHRTWSGQALGAVGTARYAYLVSGGRHADAAGCWCMLLLAFSPASSPRVFFTPAHASPQPSWWWHAGSARGLDRRWNAPLAETVRLARSAGAPP